MKYKNKSKFNKWTDISKLFHDAKFVSSMKINKREVYNLEYNIIFYFLTSHLNYVSNNLDKLDQEEEQF